MPRPNRGKGEKRPPRGGGSGAAKSTIWHSELRLNAFKIAIKFIKQFEAFSGEEFDRSLAPSDIHKRIAQLSFQSLLGIFRSTLRSRQYPLSAAALWLQNIHIDVDKMKAQKDSDISIFKRFSNTGKKIGIFHTLSECFYSFAGAKNVLSIRFDSETSQTTTLPVELANIAIWMDDFDRFVDFLPAQLIELEV